MENVDPNLLLTLVWGGGIVLMLFALILTVRLLDAIKANVDPALVIQTGEQIRLAFDMALKQLEQRAAETDTPLDDIGVAVIRIPYSELAKHLPQPRVPDTPPEDPAVG